MVAVVQWILRLLSLLPPGANQRVGSALGLMYFVLSGRSREVARRNIDACFPDLNENDRGRLLRRSFLELGKTLTELGPVFNQPWEKLQRRIVKIDGLEHLMAAVENKQGVIIAAPHLGCWEMVGLYISSLFPMTNLYRPPRQIQFDEYIRRSRCRFGATLVPTDSQGVRALFSRLKHHEVVGILPDQDPGPKGSGEFVPFFGIPAKTMALMLKLHLKTGAVILYTFMQRLPGGRYHLRFIPSNPITPQAGMEALLAQMNNHVEQCVRICPEQYQWTYKRFKSRPAGEAPFY